MADRSFKLHELHHVQLAAPADCEAEAQRFYGELMRLTEVPKPTPMAGHGAPGR